MMFQWSVALLGAVAILLTPAGWIWKCAILFLLITSAALACAGAHKPTRHGRVTLFHDGMAQIFTLDGKAADVLLQENAWLCRWLCVLDLFEPDSGRHYYCIICASENSPCEYRRLLKFLNMRTSSASIHKVTW